MVEPTRDAISLVDMGTTNDFKNLRDHYKVNKRICEQALGGYKRKRNLLVDQETGEVLSTRNLYTYRFMDPRLYTSPSRLCRRVIAGRMAVLIGHTTPEIKSKAGLYYEVGRDQYHSMFRCKTVSGMKRKFKEYLRERSFQHKVAIKENVPFAAKGLLCVDGAVAGVCDQVIYYGEERKKICIEYAFLDEISNPDYVWYEMSGSLMPRIFHSMVGHDAQAGIVITQFGLKVLWKKNLSQGRIRFFSWPRDNRFIRTGFGKSMLDRFVEMITGFESEESVHPDWKIRRWFEHPSSSAEDCEQMLLELESSNE
jgi:hypothetical protein